MSVAKKSVRANADHNTATAWCRQDRAAIELGADPISLEHGCDDDWARRNEFVERRGEIVAPAGLIGERPLLKDGVGAEGGKDAHPEHLRLTDGRVVFGPKKQQPDKADVDRQRGKDAERSGRGLATPLPFDVRLRYIGHGLSFPGDPAVSENQSSKENAQRGSGFPCAKTGMRGERCGRAEIGVVWACSSAAMEPGTMPWINWRPHPRAGDGCVRARPSWPSFRCHPLAEDRQGARPAQDRCRGRAQCRCKARRRA